MQNKLQVTQKQGGACVGCLFLFLISSIYIFYAVFFHFGKNSPPAVNPVITVSPTILENQQITPLITTETNLYLSKINSILDISSTGNTLILAAIGNVESGDKVFALSNVNQGQKNFDQASALLNTLNPQLKYKNIHAKIVEGLNDYQVGTSIMKKGAEAGNLSYATIGYGKYKKGTKLLNQAQTELITIAPIK